MTTPTQIRLRRQLTLVQFQQLCEQLHQIYPGWRQPVTPPIRAWVQVAYNGRTILIHPRRDYVLEADVTHTVQQLLNDLPEQSTASWFMAGSVWRRAIRRGGIVA